MGCAKAAPLFCGKAKFCASTLEARMCNLGGCTRKCPLLLYFLGIYGVKLTSLGANNSLARQLPPSNYIGLAGPLALEVSSGQRYNIKMAFYYTYVLKSIRDSRHYIGSTASLEQRLMAHNNSLL